MAWKWLFGKCRVVAVVVSVSSPSGAAGRPVGTRRVDTGGPPGRVAGARIQTGVWPVGGAARRPGEGPDDAGWPERRPGQGVRARCQPPFPTSARWFGAECRRAAPADLAQPRETRLRRHTLSAGEREGAPRSPGPAHPGRRALSATGRLRRRAGWSVYTERLLSTCCVRSGAPSGQPH